MKTYDWLIIGGGITGSALAYELAKKGFIVLLLEKDAELENASRYSYGGISYWAGTNNITRQLCDESINIHRHLSEELEADTEFRELNLLLTIDAQDDPINIAKNYNHFAINPQLLTVTESCQLEPLLNPKAISGALQFPHAHINTLKTTRGYQQAFKKAKGEIKIAQVVELIRQGETVKGVITADKNQYYAHNTVVCAGGLSRLLLQQAGIAVKIYFTHAQVIQTQPVDIKLNCIIMPASLKRFAMEAKSTQTEAIWDKSSQTSQAMIVDSGAVQFLDGSLRLGQISQIMTDCQANIDLASCESQLRQEISHILPTLATIPGTIHTCLVAFANNSVPLIGQIDGFQGIYLFSGFTSPLALTIPLAKRFASWATGVDDSIISAIKCN